jgi:hypothetical protein
VTSLVELTLVAEHRRGHGAMYDAVNHGQIEPERLCAAPWPRCRCPEPGTGESCSRSMSARGCARTSRPPRLTDREQAVLRALTSR